MTIVSDTAPLICLLPLNQFNPLKDSFVNVITPSAIFKKLIKAKIINDNFLQTNSFIPVKGIPGVLIPAKERKLISRVKPLINRLQTKINFRINNKLHRIILIEANER
jgi:predicted nucleic acid-binding protein